MSDNAKNFLNCLDTAGQLLEDYPPANFPETDHDPTHPSLKSFDLALFEEWSEFTEPEISQKPPIRIIQHLSCTGGTLIAKCLAAMPNVAMLSEVHPLSPLQRAEQHFAPSDLTYLAKQAALPIIDELSEKIFKANIEVIFEHLRLLGKYLVIREHSHSDYLIGDSPKEFSTICGLLKDNYQLLSVLTVRHPVDSFLSVIKQGWVHFNPPTFEEYCKRYLLFTIHNADLPICKYEDFVSHPVEQAQFLCEALDLPFNEDFQDLFDLNKLSGDSGRSTNTITPRARRHIDNKTRDEIKESISYLQLCKHLGYDISF